MLKYNPNLKPYARNLRSDMTEAEEKLWSRLRRKQLGIQFYRQRSIGNYIVDIYGPKAKLVIEVDGSHHLDPGYFESDLSRDTYLSELGLEVLRFNNFQVLQETDAVLEVILKNVERRIQNEISPNPSF